MWLNMMYASIKNALGATGISLPSNSGSQLRGKRRNRLALVLVARSKALRLAASLLLGLHPASKLINPNMLAVVSNMQMLAVVSWVIHSLRIMA